MSRPQPKVRVINHVGRDAPGSLPSMRETEEFIKKKRSVNAALQEIQSAAGNLVSSVSHRGQLEQLRNDNLRLKAAVDKLFYLLPAQ